jgi:hypothetical protein
MSVFFSLFMRCACRCRKWLFAYQIRISGFPEFRLPSLPVNNFAGNKKAPHSSALTVF